MATSAEIENRILESINGAIGADFDKLKNIQQIIDNYNDRLHNLSENVLIII